MSGFSVCQFFPTGDYEYVRRNVPAEEAIAAFKHYTSSVGAVMGTTIRVILTDDGDCINMEWERGKGITYPPGSGSENMTMPTTDPHAVIPVPTEELHRLRESHAALLAALQTIADGETMAGRSAFTHAEVVCRYQQIASRAIDAARKVSPVEWHDDKPSETACNMAVTTQPGDLDLAGRPLKDGS